MNRLKKKCVIGTVGIHLLLLTILLVGPAFFNQQPKTDNNQILDVIPANLVDAAVNSGVQGAKPPPPTPATQPPTQQLFGPPKAIQPPAPAPAPTPAPVPAPSLLDRMEKYFTPQKPVPTVTPDLTHMEKADSRPKTHTDIKIDLHKVTRTEAQRNSSPTDNAREAREINSTLRSLSHDLSSATKIDMPGNATAAYANYATVVKSVYERMLLTMLPSEISRNNENTRVTVTIANDGTVVSSHIISRSGDPVWDDVVQRTLDQVTFVQAFPEGATEKERTYTINFNPQIAREFQ